MYTIVGKNHIAGISKKTGKPYDMNILYCTAEPTPREIELEGLRSLEILVTKKLFDEVIPGETFSDYLTGSDNLVAQLI